MTDIDLAAVRAAAEGATPGPWVQNEPPRQAKVRTLGIGSDLDDEIAVTIEAHDAAYIAATSPAVVLELLDRLAAAEAAVARVRSVRALIQMWADEAEKRGPADQINTAGVVAMLAHAIKEQP